MLAIIGSVVVLASVIGSFLMEGGNLLLLWHPSEFIIILGAAIGAFLAGSSMKVAKQAFSAAIGLVKGSRYGRADYLDLLKLIYDILVKIRKSGMLAIEADIESPEKSKMFTEYPRIMADHHMVVFITDCLRLIVGGNLDPNELESLLEYELDTHHKEAAEPGHAIQKVADALPGFGIVAAVLGIVNTMATLKGADTASIGEKVGAALVGTFLGILASYGFVGPIASAVEARAHEEGKAFEVIKMALVASVRGYAPPVAVEFARKLLWSDVRPSFADLEAHLKGKKKETAKQGVAA
jgi:chemotaxis protein MotA